jgi:hypothetical protein
LFLIGLPSIERPLKESEEYDLEELPENTVETAAWISECLGEPIVRIGDPSSPSIRFGEAFGQACKTYPANES